MGSASPVAHDVFDALPKVELHCHVEGTVRPATVLELARRSGRPLPVDDPTELYRYTSLDSFLEIFWLVQDLLITPDDWARAAYESLLDAPTMACATGRCSSLPPGTSPAARTSVRSWTGLPTASRPPSPRPASAAR